jgi:hypothetical protein
MHISDYQRRRILHLIKQFKHVRKARSYLRAHSTGGSFPASRQASPPASAARSPVRVASSMPEPRMQVRWDGPPSVTPL